MRRCMWLKVITLILTLVLIIRALAACGGSKEEEFVAPTLEVTPTDTPTAAPTPTLTETPTPTLTLTLTLTPTTPPTTPPTTSPKYNLVTSVSPSGGGTITPASGIFDSGSQFIITATPASGYRFDHWSGDVANTSSPTTTITITSDTLVTAIFINITTPPTTAPTTPPTKYILTMAVSGSGSTNPAVGNHAYNAGTSVNITAQPVSGWEFDHWSGVAEPVVDPTLPSITVPITSNITITANFKQIYTLTMAVIGSGSTDPAIGYHTYDVGTSVNITAQPVSGWKFDHWSAGVANPNNQSTAITITSNTTVTAYFKQIYTLTMAVSGSGSTDPAGGNLTYDAGTSVNIKAIPANGWKLDHWSGGVANPSSLTTTVTMTSNKTVTANFTKAVDNYDDTIKVHEYHSVVLNPGEYHVTAWAETAGQTVWITYVGNVKLSMGENNKTYTRYEDYVTVYDETTFYIHNYVFTSGLKVYELITQVK